MSTFGAGKHEPYDHALRNPARSLFLGEATHARSGIGALTFSRVDIERFLGDADEDDLDAIARAAGPILDIGCGPGRMVKAAILGGELALGIDVSPVAVGIAQDRGLPVLRRSVFHELPSEGTWRTVTLLDGNIGIGGDPTALLERCAALVLGAGRGRILVETDPDPSRDRRFDAVVVDDLDRSSLPFPWAEVGPIALREYAAAAGLTLVREWSRRQRAFSEFARA